GRIIGQVCRTLVRRKEVVMRLVIFVVLLSLLGGCASHDRGYGPDYGHGPAYGPVYGPVYGPRHDYYPNRYRVTQRVIHVPVYRHYEPSRQPSYRQPGRPVHANPPRAGKPGRPALAPGYSHEHKPQRPRDGQWQGRDGRGEGHQQRAP